MNREENTSFKYRNNDSNSFDKKDKAKQNKKGEVRIEARNTIFLEEVNKVL